MSAGQVLRPRSTRYKYMYQRWEKECARTQSVLRYGDYGLKVIGRYDRLKSYTVVGQKALQATTAKLVKLLRQTDASDGSRTVKAWRHVFPHHSYTKKPAETKMGKGKGSVEGFVAVCRPGQVIFEWTAPNVHYSEVIMRQIVKECAVRLPIRVKLVERPKYKPVVPLEVEAEMKRRKLLRESGEAPRASLVPWRRGSNALEDYIAELPDEERETALRYFRGTSTPDRDAFRSFSMGALRRMKWATARDESSTEARERFEERRASESDL